MLGRVLGLDVGTKRIGVAVSDPDRIFARELTTITVASFTAGARRVIELASELNVVTIVIGLPITMAGDEGEQARITRLFGAILEREGHIPLAYVDERLTSKLSDSAMREMSLGRREPKGKRDRLSAVFILQSYLDREQK